MHCISVYKHNAFDVAPSRHFQSVCRLRQRFGFVQHLLIAVDQLEYSGSTDTATAPNLAAKQIRPRTRTLSAFGSMYPHPHGYLNGSSCCIPINTNGTACTVHMCIHVLENTALARVDDVVHLCEWGLRRKMLHEVVSTDPLWYPLIRTKPPHEEKKCKKNVINK